MGNDFIPLSFQEEEYSLRTLVTDQEHAEAYRLRHRVFAETLRWVDANRDGVERDGYDNVAVALGLFGPCGTLMGTLRLISPECGFMLNREFRALLPQGYRFKDPRQCMEVSRFAVHAEDPASQRRRAQLLYKGLYRWCELNDVRYNYIVVSEVYLRALQAIGIPCNAIGPASALPPANVKSVAAIIDWNRLGGKAHMTQSRFSAWMADVPSVSPLLNATATA